MTDLKPGEKPSVSAASSSIEHGRVMTTIEIKNLSIIHNGVKWVRQDTIREIRENLKDIMWRKNGATMISGEQIDEVFSEVIK